MDVIGLITARGGSKGIPGKNVKLLAGKPLIAWTIEAAIKSRCVSKVVLSTDDPNIAAVGEQFGASVPFIRPATLAQDASPHIQAVLHAMDQFEAQGKTLPDYVLTLQPTSPLRTAQDIDDAAKIAEDIRPDAVIGVCEASQHPYILKTIKPDGTLSNFIHNNLSYPRRQDFPVVYCLNGAIYLNRTESLRRDRTLFPEFSLPLVMPQERSLDIDTLWDFRLADLILKEKE